MNHSDSFADSRTASESQAVPVELWNQIESDRMDLNTHAIQFHCRQEKRVLHHFGANAMQFQPYELYG